VTATPDQIAATLRASAAFLPVNAARQGVPLFLVRYAEEEVELLAMAYDAQASDEAQWDYFIAKLEHDLKEWEPS
jgi:hypothetical protein